MDLQNREFSFNSFSFYHFVCVCSDLVKGWIDNLNFVVIVVIVGFD